MQAAFADIDPRTAERRSTISSNSATRPEQDRNFAPGEQMPPTLRNELAKLLTNISHSLASSKLGKMVDRMRGSSTPRNEPLAMVELESSGESLARLLALLNETVLRVGRAGARSHRSRCEAWRPSHRSAAASVSVAQVHDATKWQSAVPGDPLERGLAL
jgi:hypothetical protein